ncbi:aminotransferase class I/II-fold pyridoxal phosphate-dependent enzyme [Tahibacter soli]|uniref:Aminotransferase class I/II-fold pyridoxal phosphate-dependent enzyme n=1 Tax=Tahibacter soli TaxID=2983605 RepID=A0A9X3YMT6_9GAMM|nr:aminotransferase class I/II-fold pyridoxal phosphate-dependent enzyme [Tahibacter soli]MDC8014582.1 aminotransferase class I/II-fold pyridoxal phosphate-dependent enzyme [Tahibacter soli]
MTTLPDFRLETHFSRWEFNAKYNMAASDAQSLPLAELLALADEPERAAWDALGLGYTETWGSPALRRAIARTYETIAPEHVLCFAGAEEGLYCAMLALLGPEDHAIVTVPNYQSMETLPASICGAVSGWRLRAENGWQPDPDELRALIRPNTKLVAVNFPNNPTGAIADAATFRALAQLCDERGIHLFSDEVYRGLERDAAHRLPQAADIAARGVSLNVMSKAYGLPGLRIGWIATRDAALLTRMERMKHYLSICNAATSEVLACIALGASDTLLSRNLELCRNNLGAVGAFFAERPDLYEWETPRGGCVGFARYLGADGVEAHCRRLVEEAGVLLLPASVFESPLAQVPTDRFRVGYGRAEIAAGLDAWREFLRSA